MLKKVILAALIAVTLIVALGSVGSFANDTITFAQCAATCGVCSVLEYIALAVINE